MKEATEKMIKEMNELMEVVMEQNMSMYSIRNMDTKEFELLQKSLRLVETSTDLAIKQAEMMDKMNEKLDRLLRVKEA